MIKETDIEKIKWEPISNFGDPREMDLIPIHCWKEEVLCGALCNEDGYGYYSNEDQVSNIKVVPSDVFNDNFVNSNTGINFTHILWFNK